MPHAISPERNTDAGAEDDSLPDAPDVPVEDDGSQEHVPEDAMEVETASGTANNATSTRLERTVMRFIIHNVHLKVLIFMFGNVVQQ